MLNFRMNQVVFRDNGTRGINSVGQMQNTLGRTFKDANKPTFYSIVAQTRYDLETPENSPSVSLWPYLLATGQAARLNKVSVYSEGGDTPERIRFLYFNDFALALWGEMGKDIQVLGRVYRPPKGSLLTCGMPFSE